MQYRRDMLAKALPLQLRLLLKQLHVVRSNKACGKLKFSFAVQDPDAKRLFVPYKLQASK